MIVVDKLLVDFHDKLMIIQHTKPLNPGRWLRSRRLLFQSIVLLCICQIFIKFVIVKVLALICFDALSFGWLGLSKDLFQIFDDDRPFYCVQFHHVHRQIRVAILINQLYDLLHHCVDMLLSC